MCLYNLVILALTVLAIYSSKAAGFGICDRFLNFDNCQTAVVSDVISGTVDQYLGMDVFANFGDSRFKTSEPSFSAVFRTPITSDRKYMVTLYLVWL